MSLLARFGRDLDRLQLGPGPWLVAVSGGADSVVLLDLLARWLGDPAARRPGEGSSLVVAHVDHGIHPESGVVAELVQRAAGERGLPIVIGRLGLGAATSETRARTARLAWLRDLRRETGARWILTAHNADDQRETVLMRLLRGSGPAGLAGIAAKGRGLARPLLRFSATALRGYASERGLDFWEDPANRDPRHLRSWLRSSLIPAIAARLPDVPDRLDDARRHAARDRRAWAESLDRWPGLGHRRDDGVHSVEWSVLMALPAALRTSLAQALVRAAGATAGGQGVARGLRALMSGASGSSADLGDGWRLEVAFGRLRALRPTSGRLPPAHVLAGGTGELPWGPWTIRWGPGVAPGRQERDGRTAWFIPGTLVVRGWRAGDRLAPLGGTGHRLAARCFQDARVAASARSRWPVFAPPEDRELAWIPGVCRSSLRVPAAGAPALRVELSGHE